MGTQSKIKPIYLKLPDYEFYHSPSAKKEENDFSKKDKRFVGRKKVEDKLWDLLYESETYSGTYLVTGFRGMGKTSHVRRVINNLPKEKPEKKPNGGNRKENIGEKKVNKFISIETSLAHDEINEVDIYKSLTRNILNEFEKEYYNTDKFKLQRKDLNFFVLINYLSFTLLLTFAFSFLIKGLYSKLGIDIAQSDVLLLLKIGIPFSFFLFVFLSFMPLFENIKNQWLNTEYFKRRYKGNKIVSDLRSLKLNIEAQTTTESSSGLGSSRSFFNIFSKKQERREPLGARDIESELISILDEITKEFKYQFIIIFDELDKVDPNFNINIFDKESETPSMGQNKLGIEEKIRHRRESVVKLFSNMKHFLTVARAKFIFIAGREMFDAALADISDRESYIGSIFHDVIYVGSFMKESYLNGSTDITRLTEEYVCQFLFTDSEKGNDSFECNLRSVYEKYMQEGNTRTDCAMEVEKIIVVLQSFITFLTYRSNGAPKKITQLFENQVKTANQISWLSNEIGETEFENKIGEKTIFPHPIWKKNTNNDYYLYFNSEDQYRFNYNAKLFTPFLVTRSRYMRMYSDKLLVAATYILDHLYKFHKTAFSWGNLELTPEIIAINKAPELRNFIRSMVLDVENSHIRRIGSGLFDFSFSKLIFLEIDYLSKSFPEESAAFNFTLDESLEVKRHYTKKLWQTKNEYNKKYGGGKAEYSYSIGFMHSIMGDLHFYDQEYDEALIHYNESLETLVTEDESNVIKLKDYFVIYLKTALKLGLTYEKMNHFNNAFATYRMLSDRVLKFANRFPYQFDVGFYNGARDIKETMGYLRLLYQSNLAKLVLYEKTGLNSIVYSDVEKACEEFKGIYKNQEGVLANNPLIEVEYYSKLGDILFFKNVLFVPNNKRFNEIFYAKFKRIVESQTNYFRVPLSALDYYYKALNVFIGRVYNDKKNYAHNASGFVKEDFISLLRNVQTFLYEKGTELNNPIRKKGVVSSTAALLSRLGDTLLSCSQKSDKLSINKLNEYLSEIGLTKTANDYKISQLELSLICYRFSAAFFGKCNDMNMRSYQFRKILYVIKEYVACKNKFYGETDTEASFAEKAEFIEALKIKVFEKTLKANHEVYQNANRVELVKYENILQKDFYSDNDKEDFKRMLGKISGSTEDDELRFLLLEIELKLLGKKASNNRVLYPYSNINNQFNRVMALLHQVHLNLQALTENFNFLDNIKKGDYFNNIKGHNEFKSKIIEEIAANCEEIEKGEWLRDVCIDSIYCLTEMIKILKIWGVSFAIGNSFHAYAHEKMGDWCIGLFGFKAFCTNPSGNGGFVNLSDDIENKLEDLIGKSSKPFLDFNYNYECAQKHYYDMLNSHNEGDAYKNLIDNMYYLEDDFSSPQNMFGAAIERYQINTGIIENALKRVKKKIGATTMLYDIENYC